MAIDLNVGATLQHVPRPLDDGRRAAAVQPPTFSGVRPERSGGRNDGWLGFGALGQLCVREREERGGRAGEEGECPRF